MNPTGRNLPDRTLQEFIALYEAAAAHMRSAILHPPGNKASSQAWRKAVAEDKLQQLERLIRQLKSKAATWTGRAMTEAMQIGVRDANAQARGWGLTIPTPAGPFGHVGTESFAVIDKGAVEVLMRDAYGDLAKAADSMQATAGKLLRQTAQHGLAESDINRILAGGIIEGTPRDTIRALRQELVRVNDGQVVTITNKNGDEMHFDAAHYARLVVVTKTREAVTEARHERLRELDIDLVSIIGRVSKNFCTAFLGRVFSIGGKRAGSKYPPIESCPYGGPPFHPNCTKSTRAFIEELANDQQLAQAPLSADEKKLLNVDATKAQRNYQDLQLYNPSKERYSKLMKIED